MSEPRHRPVRAAVFDTIPQADAVVDQLLAGGFSKDQITVICSDETKERHFREFDQQEPAGSHTESAVEAGAVAGAALGGFAALVGVTATGGLGLVAAGGLLALGITGPFVGAMMTRGMEKEAADFYDQAVVSGKILVAVEDQSERRNDALRIAEKIFADAGAAPVALEEG